MTTQIGALEPVVKTGVDAFDPTLAQQAWTPVRVKKLMTNAWEFTIKNRMNRTRLVVTVHGRTAATLYINLVTADCPPLRMGSYQSHQHLAALVFHRIQKIIYYPGVRRNGYGYVDFQFSPTADRNDRKIRIFSEGHFSVN